MQALPSEVRHQQGLNISMLLSSRPQISLQCSLAPNHWPPGSQRVRGSEGPASQGPRVRENGSGLRGEKQPENKKPSEGTHFNLINRVQFSMNDSIRSFRKTEG